MMQRLKGKLWLDEDINVITKFLEHKAYRHCQYCKLSSNTHIHYVPFIIDRWSVHADNIGFIIVNNGAIAILVTTNGLARMFKLQETTTGMTCYTRDLPY